MKISITILALFIVGYSMAAFGQPPKASLCLKRSETSTVKTCIACHNWASGTIGAREIKSGACTTKVTNTVASCLYYTGLIAAAKTYNDCRHCNKMTWMNITEKTKAVSSIACSNTAVSTTTCKAKVLNCSQNLCVDYGSSTYKVGCNQCAKGFISSGTKISATNTATTVLGYSACTATGAITNCELGDFQTPTKCYTCKSGYAVVTAATSCKAFTLDSNCRLLGTGDAECVECWMAYYFNLTKCILGANIMALGGLVMFVLAFFN